MVYKRVSHRLPSIIGSGESRIPWIGFTKFCLLSKMIGFPMIIPQIDLVPTMSLLFNIPIPFTSLGKLIPELFTVCSSSFSSSSSISVHNQLNIYLLENF